MRLRRLVAALACAAAPTLVSSNAAYAQTTPERIVALSPFTANTLAALGVTPIGIGQTLGGHDRLDPSLRGVTALPLSHPNGPNLEQLAALNPQLVFSTPTWKRGAAAMRGLGMTVVESEPRTVAGVVDQTRRIGGLVGRPAEARELTSRIEKEIAAARRGIRTHPSVLLIVGVGRTPYAALANSWGGDVIRQAGGRLLTRGLHASGGLARISNETVVDRDPDIIIAVPHGSAADIPKLAKYLRTNPAWRTTKAARDKRIYVSTDDSLLQAWPDPGRVIATVRRSFLKN
ncbi:MAG TPA: ABC transporter substrate-binding protein [Solirubrobacteraceae bacterium]|nr:ABC transporter substrate-binding protein [Solirubrobacteraceae bacterium]